MSFPGKTLAKVTPDRTSTTEERNMILFQTLTLSTSELSIDGVGYRIMGESKTVSLQESTPAKHGK